MKMKQTGVMIGIVSLSMSTAAFAATINVDEILFQSDNSNPVNLSGTVSMTYDNATTLTITLKNTSGADANNSGAAVILTGLGFQLPGSPNLSIVSGSVDISASSWVGISPGTTDASKEWGFNNDPIKSGHFNGTVNTLPVNAVVSTMGTDTISQFLAGSLDGSSDLSGPDFGLVSQNGNAGGLSAIQDSVTITLTLNQSYSGLLTFIENGNVVLCFGSPDDGVTVASVPDGGATVGLLGMVCLGLHILKRKLLA